MLVVSAKKKKKAYKGLGNVREKELKFYAG